MSWPGPRWATLCGLPQTLPVMVTASLRVPAAIGAKLRLIVQLPLAVTAFPRVSVCAKPPLGVTLVMAKVAPQARGLKVAPVAPTVRA